MLISPSDIAHARAQMADMLTDTCEWFKSTLTVQDSGSSKEAYVSQGNLPCLIYLASGRRTPSEYSLVGETRTDTASNIIRLPWDTAISVSDKIVAHGIEFLITSMGDTDTNRFMLMVGADRIRGHK